MSELVDFYCLSFENTERKNNIQSIFTKLDLPVIFYEGVYYDDPRIKDRSLDRHTARCWSIMYGHLDMIQKFVNSDKKIGIFCENDILIRNDLKTYLDNFISNFSELKLDILLMGYLCTNNVHGKYDNFKEKFTTNDGSFIYKYYDYDLREEAGVWGTQMYMLNRSHAKRILELYSTGYADRTIADKTLCPFAADWTITKCDINRAMIFPIIAIEKNIANAYEDKYQQSVRDNSYKLSYSAEHFI